MTMSRRPGRENRDTPSGRDMSDGGGSTGRSVGRVKSSGFPAFVVEEVRLTRGEVVDEAT